MLPIEVILPRLKQTLEQTSTALLQAPPGAGKTTRVPLALLDAPWRDNRKILMLEPRRLAARSAARYMAKQLGEAPGQTVGYRTRLDTKISGSTRIEVVTEGILTRLIQADPMLEDYAAVLFDEFHERSLQADLGLALVRESQQALRAGLRLLVMSATLDAAPIARVLGDVPVITSEGRAFPVEVLYRPLPRNARLPDQVVAVIHEALRDQSGSLLVFLPGAGEIRWVQQQLQGKLPEEALLALLFGNLKAEEQDRAISPAPEGKRKIVLATAIAETSLTIEGVRVVIDAGQQRRAVFDANSGMTRLVTGRVSKASAEQRKGRAGRIEPGVCYRLWSESEQFGLADYTPPEIQQADLAPLVLELAQWGARSADQVAWIDPPPVAHWQQAVALLQWLDLLDGQGAITDHGKAARDLGLHPRLAHMVLKGRAAGFGQLAAELAAELDGKAREARIYLAAPVGLSDLESDLASHIEETEEAIWDDRRGTFTAREVRKLGALVLAEKAITRIDPALIQQGLLDAVRRKGLDSLPWTDNARQWCARVQLLAEQLPGDWPDVRERALLNSLETWLAPFMAGMQRWADLMKLDLVQALSSLLDFPQQQQLDQLAPRALSIPTGQKVTLDYTVENGPVLAAKLQALFGWTETPTVAGGRVPVVIHLLSPAQRPLAVTADLASFWKNAYPEVRKDMRGRYPKHPWPEDPFTALAQQGTKKRPAR